MTASSLVVTDRAAHLVADGAFYDAGGVVSLIASKIAHAAFWRMALATSGMVRPHQLVEPFDAAAGHDQAHVMRSLPAIAASIQADNAAAHSLADQERCHFQVYVAMWSDATNRPEGWLLSTNRAWLGAGYTPLSWMPVDQVVMPPIGKALDPQRFRPHRDGRRLLERQRGLVQHGGGHWVGGLGEVATVTRSGVTVDQVVRWPDRVGERIAG
jgi:hypothetical protein